MLSYIIDMDKLMNQLFSPLSKEYCDYFYYLSVIGFILLSVLVLSTLLIGLTKRKGMDFYVQMLSISFGYIIFYFQNRLLYSMCIGFE